MIKLNAPSGPLATRIVGAGSYVPSVTIDNEAIARAIPSWNSGWIERKTSIRERRFLWELDADAGVTLAPAETAEGPRSNVDMCEIALRRALVMADLPASELDAVFLVTCTPDRLNFNHDAMDLHHRLGCRTDAFAFVIDDGCGGTPYVMDMAHRMIGSGALRTVAVIGSTCTSPFVNRTNGSGQVSPTAGGKPLHAALSMYVFGDGAGAVILRGEPAGAGGIVASLSGNDHLELVIRRAGGVLNLLTPGGSPSDDTFVINGQLVAASYPLYMQRCLDGLFEARPEFRDRVKRYYFHQPNKRLMDGFVTAAGLPPERVAYNVDRYGNTSAAGMLILLAEELDQGLVRLGGDDLIVIAAVGANVHYGAQLVQL
jgi:3-oxoacyl-[acyl-carrier-protein] synthase III